MPCRWVKVGGRTSTAPSPGRRHGTAAPVGTRVVLHLVHVLGALACASHFCNCLRSASCWASQACFGVIRSMPKRFLFFNESKSGDLRDEKWVGTHRRGKSKEQEGQKEQEKKSFGHPLLMGPGNSGFLPGVCELSGGTCSL